MTVWESFTLKFLESFQDCNHYGNLQSRHYVTNLKVGEKWFQCNDAAHVCDAGVGDGEAEVLRVTERTCSTSGDKVNK
jgi:hypothetical protein